MGGKQSASTAQMYRNLAQTLRDLILNPTSEWQNIHRQSTTFNDMLSNFALPQIALVTFGTFMAYMINQQAFIFELALKKAFMVFIALFGGLFLAWYLVFRLMKYFQIISSRELAAKLTIFSSAPIYATSLVTALVPEFFFIQVFTLYCFYLTWTGVRLIPGPASEKKFVFSLMAGLSILLFPFLIRIVLLNFLTL